MRTDAAKLAFWKRTRPERVMAHPSDVAAVTTYPHYWVPSWNKFPLPDPGAEAYVYEGLIKQPESVYGRGGIPYTPLRLTQVPMVQLPTQTPIGVGVLQGTFWMQPLYDPTQGVLPS